MSTKNQKQDAGSLAPIKKKTPKKLSSNKEEVVKVDLSDKKPDQQSEDIHKIVLETKDTEEKIVEEIKDTKSENEIVELNSQAADEQIEDIEPKIVELEQDKEIKPLVDKDPLPENIEKLVKFMEETGGDINDYARLNADYSSINDDELLRQYYAKSKPHLNNEEINFVLEDQFSYDEEVDEERSVKKKKLAYKEEIIKAKNYLEGLKKEYYDEIKLRPSATQEQLKALDFYNKYNQEQEKVKEKHGRFSENTKKFFSDEFKGFEFNVAEKRFRYNVNDMESLADKQSNLNNFVGKFFDKAGELKNYNDYHKAIYTAENADTLMSHFYEQGKADAVKDMMAKSKNVDNKPRTTSTGDVFVNGLKVKAIDGVNSSKLKLRINKK